MEKPFACSICHKAFAKLNSLGDHVENVHILQKSSEKSQENHSDFGKSNQSESNFEEIKNNSENNSDPKNIENYIVDQSEPDCEKIKNHSDQQRIENVTGKSFSEALILSSSNPQDGKSLFIELQVQY